MTKRQHFPGEGIYEAVGGIPDSYYVCQEHARRYRYLEPAYPQDRDNRIVIADCWIVDANGEVNPGTNVSPVPFCLEALGRRIDK